MEVEGVVKYIIFENEDNDFRIFRLETEDGEITCVGESPSLFPGESVKIFGDMVYHDTHGEQLAIRDIEKIGIQSNLAIQKYLEAVLPQVGEAISKRIVKAFGESTLDVLENNPERLLNVEGIGKKRLADIIAVLEEEKGKAKYFVEMQELGLTIKQAKKVLEHYQDESLEVLRTNPYDLIDTIAGIGFKTADLIALKQDFDPESLFRIKAGMRYFLEKEASMNGHCFFPKEEALAGVSNLLSLPVDRIDEVMQDLIIDRVVVRDSWQNQEILYHPSLYEMEERVAYRLGKILATETDLYIDVDQAMEEIQERADFTFGVEQLQAIQKAFEEKVLIITGGPGTGKTTIIREIVRQFEQAGLDITLAAPTGRAAKRMEEACTHQAMTIHRLLGYKPLNDEQMIFQKDFYDPLDTDLVIIDEASMIDIYILRALLDAVLDDTRLIFVGDVDQLPSVGPGNVLRDMIESKKITTFKLEEIYRQNEESNIIVNAHRINHGKFPILNEKNQDFFFIDASKEESYQTVLDLMVTRLPGFYETIPVNQMQVLTPMKKTSTGTKQLNQGLQEVLNPKLPNKEELAIGDHLFREGDKVMQVKNNYEKEFRLADGNLVKGVYNGDFGVIQSIDSKDETMELVFDEDKRGTYQKHELNQIELAYAITIHKSQGSEFPLVLIPVERGPYLLMTRNLIYTGITRATDVVVLVGSRQALFQMIQNNFIQDRYTKLSERIVSYEQMHQGEIE